MFGDYLRYGSRESKVVEGVAMIAGAVVLGALTFGAADLALAPGLVGFLGDAAMAVGIGGISTTLMGIAQDLQPGPSMPFSIRQPAAPRQIVYGQMRVAYNIVYIAASGDNHDLNQVIVWAAHGCESVDTVYLNGRAVVLSGNTADSNDHQDASGNTYNLGGKVHIYHNLGPVPGTYFSDLGSRDANWDSSCTLDGLTASYIRCEFDQDVFPTGQPQVAAAIHGKNNIWDPRDKTPKYTNNAALVINDLLCNPDYGLGLDYNTEIDEEQLIAAANLCDEQVALAAGGTESRYTINGVFSTAETPGDTLQDMLYACGGAITYAGGKYGIYPGAWWGSDLSFDENDIVSNSIKWTPNAKTRDKCNAVRASFISPNYPYASVGFDQDHRDDSIFQGEWQPTNAPEYAQDPGHGYESDANLAADGMKLYDSLTLRFVTSVGQAQRVMKMYLLKKRLAGTGTIAMGLSAYRATAQDVITMSFAPLSWTNKYMEVVSSKFTPGGQQQSSGGDAESEQSFGQVLQVELTLRETDPSVYAWSTAEERTIDNSASPAINNIWQVNPPTNLVMESGLDSAVTGVDGIVQPRIHVTWTEPLDPFVISGGSVELQWIHTNDPDWHSVGKLAATTTDYFLPGVVSGQLYFTRIRAVRPNGSTSAWVEAGPHTVSTLYSNYTFSDGSALGALAKANAVDFASGTQVLNKTASHLTYSDGLTAEQLKPAEAGAEATTGKSIDILVDGTTYARVQTGQLQNGVVLGKSIGANMLGNPGFENNTSNSTYGDEWIAYQSSGLGIVATREVANGVGHSGPSDLLIRIVQNDTLSAGAFLRITSPPMPIIAGKGLYWGGYMRWDSNAAIPVGASIVQRIGLIFLDVNGGYINEDVVDFGSAGGVQKLVGWTLCQHSVQAPAGAATVRFECSLFNVGSQVGVGAGLVADCRWDDLFLYQQYDSSSVLAPQGSIMPGTVIEMSYTAGSSYVTFNWGNQSVLRSDGSSLSIQLGTFTFGNTSGPGSGGAMTPGATYYFYAYIDVSTGLLFWTSPNPASTTPNATWALQCYNDGRYPVVPMKITLPNTGTSGGTGGGEGTCPEAAELVEIEGKGQVKAGDVQIGDQIKGKCFATGKDIYRRVIQIRKAHCSAWRMVSGHRVSPCEQVYVNNNWAPAYMASAQVDTMNSTKILISVEADQYNEMNYYLVAGDQLLIHNSMALPC